MSDRASKMGGPGRRGDVRVMICDDSASSRRLLELALRDRAGVRVVASAANGQAGLSQIALARPDVVILDRVMPVMDGMEMLRCLRERFPRIGVIMFSTDCAPGRDATLEALSAGAHDYVPKPAGGTSFQQLGDALERKILALAGRRSTPPVSSLVLPSPATRRAVSRPAVSRPHPSRPTVSRPSSRPPMERSGQYMRPRIAPEIVAIGASTGGPAALQRILESFARPLDVPIVITQHMPPAFTRDLAARLDRVGPTRVVEGRHGVALEPGHAYVAPGAFHMAIVGRPGHLRLRHGELENGCRPAVDRMLRTVASSYGPSALAVLLTGMGRDGADGAAAIRARRGIVLAQDEATSVVWGMPGVASREGSVHELVPLDELGQAIVMRVGAGAAQRRSAVTGQ